MLKGSMPALVTPFTNGKPDIKVLKALVDWHVEQGTHGVVPVGTTGESPTLSHEEHDMVVAAVVEQAAGRIPVVAGAGSNSTAETVRLTRNAKEVGADAALVVTPYYNKPNPAGIIAHFTQAAQVGLPIVVYNIPGRCGVDILPDTMKQLAALPEVIGVKDATGDLARVPLTRIACGTQFIQLSGEDATALGFNAHGGRGCISVTANVAPALCAALQNATLAGEYDTALTLLDKLMPLNDAIFKEPGLVGVKYAMSLLDLCAPEVRLPLIELSEPTKRLIRDAMRHAGLL